MTKSISLGPSLANKLPQSPLPVNRQEPEKEKAGIGETTALFKRLPATPESG